MADQKNFEELYNKEVEAHEFTKLELTEAQTAIKLLSKKVNAPSENKPAKLPVVKVNGAEYQWTVPTVNFEGTILTAADASKDKKVCERLVAMKFGGLQPLE